MIKDDFMRNLLFFTILLPLTLLFYCSQPEQKATRVPYWEENFDQEGSFDTTRWSKIPRGAADWNRHMSDYEGCYAMRDGKLIFRGIKNPGLAGDTAEYLTGGVYTKGKVSFGFGRLEISARLNGAEGAWPAFWMLAEGKKYPQGGEIDIMERLNFDTIVYQTVHSYYTIKLNIKDDPVHYGTASFDPEGFNVFAVEKHPDSVVFFVNDKRTFGYPRISTDKEEQFPFAGSKHYLLLDMQLGGNWVGAINPDHLPVEVEIDWVRFYKF